MAHVYAENIFNGPPRLANKCANKFVGTGTSSILSVTMAIVIVVMAARIYAKLKPIILVEIQTQYLPQDASSKQKYSCLFPQ